MKRILSVGLILFFAQQLWAGLESLPVQDGGRIKPYDTLARESLSLIWGKETYKGKPATEIVFSWMLIPDEWEKTEFVLVRHSGLREALKLDNQRLYYSPNELMTNDRLGLMIQDLKNKREAQEKLDPFYQAVQTLENQLSVFHAVRLGLALRVMPAEAMGSAKPWHNISELEGEYKDKFQAISQSFVKMAQSEPKGGGDLKTARAEVDKTVDVFINAVKAQFGDYANDTRIAAEVHYGNFHPFRYAWAIYLLALIFFSAAYFGTRRSWEKIGWICLGTGFLFHTWGFALRVYILGRAPVTNMFETVVWVAWVSLVFSTILYRVTRIRILPIAASMVAVLGLILCDVSSTVLDSSFVPLQPVLRDNFWLLTHVVIIVSSYAAYFLAFFIGDIVLYYFLKDEVRYKEQIQQGVQAIYRCMQIGVVLLASGVILGGVWADYSWGRFWGWDPKETWAFIALMGYVIILHGRIIGWLKSFGMAAAAVVAFSLVIMSWYGVNFVLGAGLHTYGFGAGGVEYVSAFVAAHLLFVAYVTTLRQSRLKTSKT